jgi:acetyltransferase-like isoleucine patch superfamily enzyme
LDANNIDDALRKVVTRIIRRGIWLGGKKGRIITIARSASADPIDIRELNPDIPAGADRLGAFLKGRTNFYTFAGLGKLSEKNRIHWTALNRPLYKRFLLSWLVLFAMVFRAGRFKNSLYRLAGVKLGKDTEIMQACWIDQFCPELIEIGDNSLVGAFCKLSSHAYEGGGKFRVGLVRIGDNCILASGVSMGAIRIGDGTRVLPNTTLSPYFARLHKDSLVSYPPPIVTRETDDEG